MTLCIQPFSATYLYERDTTKTFVCASLAQWSGAACVAGCIKSCTTTRK